MSRRPKRSQPGPPSMEGSWRIVEGEHDSFDTTLAPLSTDPSEGGSFRGPVSSGSALPSQLSTVPSEGSFARGPITSQGGFSMGSQDSIRDFSRYEGDENVILREPFRPTLRGQQTTGRGSEEMQLKMPRVDVFSSETSASSSKQSRKGGLRERLTSGGTSRRRPQQAREDSQGGKGTETGTGTFSTRISSFAADTALWMRVIRWPVALLLAISLFLGLILIGPSHITSQSSSSSSSLVSPICTLSRVSPITLPFCPPPNQPTACKHPPPPPAADFQDLMVVQDKFERLFKYSLRLSSLPREKTFFLYLAYELERLVTASDSPRQREIGDEMRRYSRLAQSLTQQIHSCDAKLGDAVDSIANYDRWTLRQISIIHAPPEDEAEDMLASSGGVFSRWARWLPSRPLRPLGAADLETRVRHAFVQLAIHMSLEIGAVIGKAETTLQSLAKGERILEDARALFVDSSTEVSDQAGSVVARLWARLVGNRGKMMSHDDPRALLQRAMDQQKSVAGIVAELVAQLQTMQTDTNDARDKLSRQTQLKGGVASHETDECDGAVEEPSRVPLDRQLEVLRVGIERLEAARDRVRGKDYGIPKVALRRQEI